MPASRRHQLLNMTPRGGPVGLLLHPTGTLSVPRFSRWFFVKEAAALRRDLLSIADDRLVRVIPGHGAVVAADAAARLREAAARLG